MLGISTQALYILRDLLLVWSHGLTTHWLWEHIRYTPGDCHCFICKDFNFHLRRLLPNVSQTAANQNSQICLERPQNTKEALAQTHLLANDLLREGYLTHFSTVDIVTTSEYSLGPRKQSRAQLLL